MRQERVYLVLAVALLILAVLGGGYRPATPETTVM